MALLPSGPEFDEIKHIFGHLAEVVMEKGMWAEMARELAGCSAYSHSAFLAWHKTDTADTMLRVLMWILNNFSRIVNNDRTENTWSILGILGQPNTFMVWDDFVIVCMSRLLSTKLKLGNIKYGATVEMSDIKRAYDDCVYICTATRIMYMTMTANSDPLAQPHVEVMHRALMTAKSVPDDCEVIMGTCVKYMVVIFDVSILLEALRTAHKAWVKRMALAFKAGITGRKRVNIVV